VEKLVKMIHQFADDREIDFRSLQYIFEECGAVVENENDLLEMKQSVDEYLQHFDQSYLAKIAHRFNVVDGGANTRKEGYTSYATRGGR